MQFKLSTLITVFLTAGGAHAAAQIAPSDVVSDLTQLTASVTNTNNILQQLSPINVNIQIPVSISGLTSILSDLTEVNSALDLANGTLSTPSVINQTQICDALTTFLTAYQNLTTTLEGKLSILNNIPGFGPIVAQVLSSALTGVDPFVTEIIAQVPICGADPAAQLNGLIATLSAAIKALGGAVPAVP